MLIDIESAEARKRMDRRQTKQAVRAAHGVKNGELTKGEFRSIKRGQRRVRRAERKAKADGDVTLKEKAKIEAMQDRQSRKIYRLKHNDKNRDSE